MSTRNDDLRDLSGMAWLVAARNQIQSLMLDLYDLVPKQSKYTRRKVMRTVHLLIGASFSLWRAVFLIKPEDVERSPEKIGADAREFLERVIKRNAITFADEMNLGEWTSGYYLNNAKYRIQRLRGDRSFGGRISRAVLKQSWNKLFNALEEAIAEFRSSNA